MILSPTIQSNPSRTITGLINFVFNGDTFIICDTSLSSVAIKLLELPANYLNTAYKLYIVDSGNSSINNITINAPIGYTINGLSSVLINVNKGVAVITIADNNAYLCQFSFGSGNPISVVNNQNPFLAPSTLTTALSKITIKGLQTTNSGNEITIFNDFVTLTFAQFTTLVASSSLITNQGYLINNAVYGNETINVFCLATTSNQISNSATGNFYNADYLNVGNYSGISGFVGQLGIWNTSLVTPTNSVVIWNNKHFLNITGSNGVVNPFLDLVNWQILSNSTSNGYLLVTNKINYDYSNNLVISREDVFQNKVTFFQSGMFFAFNVFKWGDPNVQNNQVINSIFYNCNSVFTSCIKNNITNSRVFFGDGINLNANFNDFSYNYFLNSGKSAILYFGNLSSSSTTNFISNEFIECIGSINGVGLFNTNYFNNCNLSISNDFEFTINNFVQTRAIIGGGINSEITANKIAFSLIQLNNTNSLIKENNLNYSALSVLVNTGTIFRNRIFDNSQMLVDNNLAPGLISYNVLENQSEIILNTNTGIIGNATEGNFLNRSVINISNNSASLLFNKLFNSKIEIANNNTNAFSNNFLSNNSQIEIGTNNGNFQNLVLFECTFGNLTITNNTNFVNGTYQNGNQSILIVLDCNDPLIYDLPTQKLTIPLIYKNFGGKYQLLNANGLTITTIINLSGTGEQTILNSVAEITTFQTTSVGVVAGLGELVSSLSPTPYNIILNGRVFGSDNFKVFQQQNVNNINEINIFV